MLAQELCKALRRIWVKVEIFIQLRDGNAAPVYSFVFGKRYKNSLCEGTAANMREALGLLGQNSKDSLGRILGYF